MDPAARATLRAGRGLLGNADQGGRRHVVVIASEVWDDLRARLGPDIDPVARRANLMVSGVPLARSRGRVLRVGACRLRIGGECTPCERMDDAFSGLRRALEPDWRGGVFAVVLDDGTIALGDEVRWEDG